tara:strand:+ start:7116 stop:7754 length:639 start_codon:yes stop_codon:yes gene_type:complete
MLSNIITLLAATTLIAGTGDYAVHYEMRELPMSYEELVEEATFACPYRKWQDVDEKLLWKLVDIEKKYNVPDDMRGMILAAACMESGYNPTAKGDYRKGKKKRVAKAVGILQLWPWYERATKRGGYAIDRKDPAQAAEAWISHIVKQIPKVKNKCGFKNETRIWMAAWAYGVRYPKPEGRCYDRVRHLKVLKKWHKNIKRIRKRSQNDGDGC